MDFSTLIAARLRELRQVRGWTVEGTAKRLSEITGETIIKTRYSNWESGFRKPKIEEIYALSQLFDAPFAYVAGASADNGTAPVIGDYTVPNQQMFFTAQGIETIDQADDGLAFKRALLEELKLDRNKILTIRAIDDSMTGVIDANDRVLIDLTNTQPGADDLFAILANGRVTIRWITNELTGGYLVRAEKRDRYPDQPISTEDIGKLKIIGRVALIAKPR